MTVSENILTNRMQGTRGNLIIILCVWRFTRWQISLL